jgi:hypothetical protein
MKEQRSGNAVDECSAKGDPNDRSGIDSLRRLQTQDRLPEHAARRHEQKGRIGERSENGQPTVAVGTAFGRFSLRQHRGGACQEQAENVAEIVTGVGEESHGVRKDSKDGFDDDERKIKKDADAKRARRVGVGSVMDVRVLVTGTRMLVTVVMAAVIHRACV